MITESTISMSQYTRVSATISYSQTQAVRLDSEQNKPVEEQLGLNEAFDSIEKLKSAETEEDLLALLKAGQEHAREVMDKFRDMAKGLMTGDKKAFDPEYVNQLMTDSVHDAVEGILNEQMEKLSEMAEDGTVISASVSVSVEVSVSFEARVMMSMNERDPDFFEQLMEMLEENLEESSSS